MDTDLMFSSKKQDWETPQWLFDKLNNVFNFKIDLAANKENAKCVNYYNETSDSLDEKTDWNFKKGWCWLNPPYGRELNKWVRKCVKEYQKGINICLLIPSRTETIYQHEYIFKHAKMICFIKGRLKFEGAKHPAPFPSQLVIFTQQYIDDLHNQYTVLSELGYVIC